MNFIFSGSETRAIKLCKIPFTHPSELLQIFNHLRQQILFNELVSSCTKSTGDPTDPSQEFGNTSLLSLLSIPISFLLILFLSVFEIVFESPYTINILFLFNSQFVTLSIAVEFGGYLKAFLTAPLHEHSKYANDLLNTSHHIPLTLHNLYLKLDNAMVQ